MTACPEWKDRLLDSALGVAAPQDLEKHLMTCTACADAVSELRARSAQMDAGLRKLVQGAEPSPAFRAQLLALLEARRRVGWPAAVGVVAAIAAVVVWGVFLTPWVKRWAAGPTEPVAVSVSAPPLSQWRSPTEVLLRSSTTEFFRSSPRLGEFYFLIKSNRPGATADKRKWRDP